MWKRLVFLYFNFPLRNGEKKKIFFLPYHPFTFTTLTELKKQIYDLNSFFQLIEFKSNRPKPGCWIQIWVEWWREMEDNEINYSFCCTHSRIRRPPSHSQNYVNGKHINFFFFFFFRTLFLLKRNTNIPWQHHNLCMTVLQTRKKKRRKKNPVGAQKAE